ERGFTERSLCLGRILAVAIIACRELDGPETTCHLGGAGPPLQSSPCCSPPHAICLRERRTIMISTVIGGSMLPPEPPFFTMPDTEDKAVVARVREVAADVGKRLRALMPDLWIIFSNDHAEQFFHTTAPPFTIHVGGEATGEFAGRKFRWQV